jgi:hypothetical protein
MDKTTVYLDEDDYRRLKQIAQREGASAEYSWAVAEYAARHGHTPRPQAWRRSQACRNGHARRGLPEGIRQHDRHDTSAVAA